MQKLTTVNEEAETTNLCETARKWKVAPTIIRYRRGKYEEIKKEAEYRRKSKLLNRYKCRKPPVSILNRAVIEK